MLLFLDCVPHDQLGSLVTATGDACKHIFLETVIPFDGHATACCNIH